MSHELARAAHARSGEPLGWLLHLLSCRSPGEPPRFPPTPVTRTVICPAAGEGTEPPLTISHTPDGWLLELAAGGRLRALTPAAPPRADEAHGSLIFTYGDQLFALNSVCHVPPADADGLCFHTNHAGLAAQITRLERIARADLPVLIAGETGTGKELVARALHARSGRGGRLVAVNCGALPRELVHSLLFGHCRGAFSGAHGNHPGFVREADGGTLFLDEIGELPLEVQPVLLRCLQESEITPVGAARPSKVDFRLVSATNRNLPAMVAAGQFREDLYSRLFGLEIQLPPLRERLEDIGLLIRSILQRSSSCSPGQRFEPEATLAILSHGWPMNVRELERCLHCAVVLAGDEPIGLRHLPAAVRASEDRWTVHQGPALLISRAGGLVDAASAVARLSDEDERRRDHLVQLMRKHRGNVAAVSSELGKARMQIHRWLKRYAINPYPYRAS